jgi:hypothetical protein
MTNAATGEGQIHAAGRGHSLGSVPLRLLRISSLLHRRAIADDVPGMASALAYKTLVSQEMLAKGYLAGNSVYNPVNHRYYRDAIRIMRDGGDRLKELYEHGVLGADFGSQELRTALRELQRGLVFCWQRFGLRHMLGGLVLGGQRLWLHCLRGRLVLRPWLCGVRELPCRFGFGCWSHSMHCECRLL